MCFFSVAIVECDSRYPAPKSTAEPPCLRGPNRLSHLDIRPAIGHIASLHHCGLHHLRKSVAPPNLEGHGTQICMKTPGSCEA